MTRLPRVAHVIRPEPQGSIGGADLHVVELAAAQRIEGLCSPSVIALGASNDFLRRAQGLGVDVHDPWARSNGPWCRLATLPSCIKVDLVHAHGYEADYVAAIAPVFAASWRRLPKVFTCHGLIETDIRLKVMTALDLACMRAAHALIAVTDHSAKNLRQRVPHASVHAIPNGVLPPRSAPASADVARVRAELGAGVGDVLIGFVGRLSTEKRPDLFLAAAERVANTFPNAKFALIGGGPLEDLVRDMVAASAFRDRFAVAGLRHDIEEVFGALDILVLPSDIEGTPRVVIEAQLRRVAVIATEVGGVPSLVTDGATGLLVPPKRVDSLALALMRLLSIPDLRRKLAEHAARSASGRTAYAMSHAVQRVYDEVLGGTYHAHSHAAR